MKYIEILFWTSLAIVFYTYVGYGILLWIAVKVKEMLWKPAERPMPTDDELPHMTLFITAYNEEEVVDEKMANCLQLDYPREKLHIVWCTDGSNDRTCEYLRRWPQATVLHHPTRRGKTAAMNRGMEQVHTPLVTFTDANTRLNPEALRRIAHAFLDPRVGCVAGEKRIIKRACSGAAQGGEGAYWRYESALKRLDAQLTSACGAAGELFAIRRDLFCPMEEDTLLDDFVLSLRIVMQGYSIAYRSDAYAEEGGSADMGEEEKRKVRIAAGGLQSIVRLRPLLNPLRYGLFSLQYISHRVLRWSLTPVLLFLLLPLGAVLPFGTSHPVAYALLFLLQALFYLAGSLGYMMQRRHMKSRLLFIPYYFLFMNANVLRGMRYLARRNRSQAGTWEKTRRASSVERETSRQA